MRACGWEPAATCRGRVAAPVAVPVAVTRRAFLLTAVGALRTLHAGEASPAAAGGTARGTPVVCRQPRGEPLPGSRRGPGVGDGVGGGSWGRRGCAHDGARDRGRPRWSHSTTGSGGWRGAARSRIEARGTTHRRGGRGRCFVLFFSRCYAVGGVRALESGKDLRPGRGKDRTRRPPPRGWVWSIHPTGGGGGRHGPAAAAERASVAIGACRAGNGAAAPRARGPSCVPLVTTARCPLPQLPQYPRTAREQPPTGAGRSPTLLHASTHRHQHAR